MKVKILRLLAVMLAVCLLAGCQFDKEAPEALDSTAEPTELWADVALLGGSGRATVRSPAKLRRENGSLIAEICWSSSNYDFMLVNEEKYFPVNSEGNAVFEIPIPSENCTVELRADTTAMSTPHLIEYTLVFGAANETGGAEVADAAPSQTESGAELSAAKKIGSMELAYAQQFTADYYEGGLSLISIGGERDYLLVPEGGSAPEGLPEAVTVLQQPLENLYLVSSSAMDMFAACEAVGSLRFCSQEESSWYVEAAVQAMKDGTLQYAGKYSAPDYELLRAGKCGLAIENTMISHSPEVIEKLEALGIPVLIERSSYEKTPQGRMEWVKLYGLLTGNLSEAEAAFERQMEPFERLANVDATGQSVAFFYFTQSGTVSVRNASDYIPKMIELAGGQYLFSGLGKDAVNASTTIQLEEFYAAAKNADFLVYNSTISGELKTLKDLLSLSPLLANCKAVQENRVYCMAENVYQSVMELGDFTADLHSMLTGGTEMTYLYQLQ